MQKLKWGGGGRGRTLIVRLNCFAAFPRQQRHCFSLSYTGANWHQAITCNGVLRGDVDHSPWPCCLRREAGQMWRPGSREGRTHTPQHLQCRGAQSALPSRLLPPLPPPLPTASCRARLAHRHFDAPLLLKICCVISFSLSLSLPFLRAIWSNPRAHWHVLPCASSTASPWVKHAQVPQLLAKQHKWVPELRAETRFIYKEAMHKEKSWCEGHAGNCMLYKTLTSIWYNFNIS